MSSRVCRLLALPTLLIAGTAAHAQAFRPIPVPRSVPVPSGPHSPHFHLPWDIFGDSDLGMYILIGVGALALIGAGLCAGSGLGRWQRGVPRKSGPGVAAPGIDAPVVLPMQDLIISPDEVKAKSLRTTRLLLSLAKTEPPFNPEPLREWIRDFFHQVQECWQARDPAPVKKLMTPLAFARYDELIRAMRRNHEINRLDDLQLRRLEFVQVWRPAEVENHTVTVLVTFEAKAYFVHETTGAYRRGARKNSWFQEFWTFQRHGDGWRLHQVQQSWVDAHLEAPNRVDGLSDGELQNVERGVILL
jgi:hypothetical protein